MQDMNRIEQPTYDDAQKFLPSNNGDGCVCCSQFGERCWAAVSSTAAAARDSISRLYFIRKMSLFIHVYAV